MTENKLTWVMLRKEVVRRTGMTDKEVNTLLSAWIDIMSDAVNRGEELHINGLGTFKVQQIAARKSVNVVTGEDIVLAPYSRVKFVASTGLMNILNEDEKPATLNPAVDPIKKLSDQADEIIDILGELGQGPKVETKPEDIQEPDKSTEPEQEQEQEREKEEEKEQTIEIPQSPKTEKPKPNLWKTAILTIVSFLVMLCLGFLILQHKVEDWLNTIGQKVETPAQVVEQPVVLVEPDTICLTDTMVADTLPEVLPETATEGIPQQRVYTEFIASETFREGSRLTQVAYRHYGNRALWVFIYEANKAKIEHPSLIHPGTILDIPKLPASWMDKSNEDNVRLWKQLENEYKDL